MPELNSALIVREYEYYIADQISVIPCRDKPETYKGREYGVKSAYPWKKWQSEIISNAEMYDAMFKFRQTTAFAIVGGKVSGNLEIIDIDVKNWLGIDSRLFSDIKSFFPQLFDRLRIHQTPSKGYHILYKISDHEAEGNKKLAWHAESKEAALETRGEGGYVVASSAMGYRVVKDNPIPSITWEERCSLIALCEGYNEKVKVKTQPVATALVDYYDENPFEHFNNSAAAESVLLDHGWKPAGNSNAFIWFTRPESKTKSIHASFNRSKRVYYIFTSNTQFEPDTGYNPSTALSILKHSGNKKATFKYLIDNGYGKLKPEREKKIAENSARKNLPLPGNLSAEAKLLSATIKAQIEETHPHGIFWEYNEDSNCIVNREMLMIVSDKLGFKYHDAAIVRIEGQLVHKMDERKYQDTLKAYIKEPDIIEYCKIANAFEAFMESHGKYTMARLPILDKSMLLNDTPEICYKFFLNGYLCIQSANISFLEYDTLEALVWAEKVQPRNYNKYDGGIYVDYLKKALVNFDASRNIIGYLSHEYKDETTAFIIVLTEQCPDPKQGGGSGKNVFCNLLSYTTTYTSKPGVQTKFDEKFFQSWNGQKIFGISDVPKNFDFSFLKEPSSGNFILKKLHKDEKIVSIHDAPKMVVQTNFSYECSDGGLARRLKPLEFTNFFTLAGGIDVHYKKHFPLKWTIEDWGGFDTFIAECVQSWINSGLKLETTALTATGWEKQFAHTYGENAYDFITHSFDEWVRVTFISNDEWKSQLTAYYRDNDIPEKYHLKKTRLFEAITIYCEKKRIIFEPNYAERIMNSPIKGKKFLEMAPF